jgi:hypothetical protein
MRRADLCSVEIVCPREHTVIGDGLASGLLVPLRSDEDQAAKEGGNVRLPPPGPSGSRSSHVRPYLSAPRGGEAVLILTGTTLTRGLDDSLYGS